MIPLINESYFVSVGAPVNWPDKQLGPLGEKDKNFPLPGKIFQYLKFVAHIKLKTILTLIR